jgi:D-alanyl-D-alanine dipeptidase
MEADLPGKIGFPQTGPRSGSRRDFTGESVQNFQFEVSAVNRCAGSILSVIFLAVLALVTTDCRANADIPNDASSDLKRLIGEYSAVETADYGPADTRLTIGEAGGKLFADGFGLHLAPLRQMTATRFAVDEGTNDGQPMRLEFALDSRRQAVAVRVGSTRLPRRDIGREIVETIRAGVNADPARLRRTALAAKPPVEAAPARAFDLVDLATVDPTIKFDIRYAGSDNLIGLPLYERPAAYLQRPAAEALGRVEHALASKGYGLLVYDGYRPWFVTKMFWDATPATAHVFVADPSQGSRHNRGCAVDLTLYDLRSGEAVEMTGRYDEMSRRSYVDYAGGTSRQRWLRELLQREMQAQGFAPYAEEWWHFDYQDWSQYAIGTATFSELTRSTP